VPATVSSPSPARSTPAAAPPAPATGGSVLVGEIAATERFDPKPTIDSVTPRLLGCYNQVRAANPALHGKMKLRIQVNEAGTVLKVDSEPGGSANDPTLLECIATVVKDASFPKPGGMATVVAPLVFRR
jgi:hypothetical protein